MVLNFKTIILELKKYPEGKLEFKNDQLTIYAGGEIEVILLENLISTSFREPKKRWFLKAPQGVLIFYVEYKSGVSSAKSKMLISANEKEAFDFCELIKLTKSNK